MTPHTLRPFGAVVVVAVLCLAFAATSQAALTANLVIYCPMNNITSPVQANYWQDVSGNAFHSLANPPGHDGTSEVGGANRGTAVDFTAITEPQYNPNQITFADGLNANLEPGTTDFSFSFWYNQTELDAGTDGATRYFFTKGNSGSADPGFIVYTKSGAVSIRSQDLSGDVSGKFTLQHTDELGNLVNLAATGWHHVAGVFDRSGVYRDPDSVTLYIDGSPVKTGVLPLVSGWATNNISAPTIPLFIAGKDGGTTQTADYEGYLDDIAFYRGALSDAQVQTIYNATSFDQTTVSGVTPVFVHNFVTNANINPVSATVPDVYGTPKVDGAIHGDVTQVTDATRGDVLSFNTRNLANYVDFGDNFDPGTTSYTVAMWVKRDDLTSTEIPVSKGNAGTQLEAWSVGMRAETHPSGYAGLTVRANYTGDNTNRMNVLTETAPTAGEWHHVALVLDQAAGLFQAYIDGVGSGADGDYGIWNCDETSYTVTFPNDGTADFDTTVKLLLGKYITESGAFMGDIDDLAIWTRALTSAEILSLYEGTEILPSVVIPGDATGEGVVNQLDADRLAQNWGATTQAPGLTWWQMGDFNNDHVVNAADAAILTANWGYGTTEASGVPEPGTLILLLGSIVWLAAMSRGRRE